MIKPKVLLLYGWHGSDAPHWQDWLYHQLLDEGYEVSFPQLSDNTLPKKEVWLREASEAFNALKPDIVIAHSMGNTLWQHLCNEGLVGQIERLLMVAPPRDLSDYEEVSEFFPVGMGALNSKDVLMVSSTNDPYMSTAEAAIYARAYNIKQKVFQNAGHINSDSGFGPWPWVLEWVKGSDR
jgi:predicted alpha/beta hydrolase family esterase